MFMTFIVLDVLASVHFTMVAAEMIGFGSKLALKGISEL
jgi:hypothetical protein